MDKENMNSMKKKALAFAAAACAFGMLLSGCGSSNGDSTADKGSNVITAYNSEPQNPLIPGDCNETGGGKPLDLLFARLISFDAKGNASVWVIDAENKIATRKITASRSIGTSWLVESGLKAGDRIVSIDNTEVAQKTDLGTLMQEHSAGDTLSITVARDGQMQTVSLTLGEKNAANSGNGTNGASRQEKSAESAPQQNPQG